MAYVDILHAEEHTIYIFLHLLKFLTKRPTDFRIVAYQHYPYSTIIPFKCKVFIPRPTHFYLIIFMKHSCLSIVSEIKNWTSSMRTLTKQTKLMLNVVLIWQFKIYHKATQISVLIRHNFYLGETIVVHYYCCHYIVFSSYYSVASMAYQWQISYVQTNITCSSWPLL